MSNQTPNIETMTSNAPSTPAGVASQRSPFGVEETLEHLEQLVRDRGLTVFARFDHSREAARAGLTMPPAHVLVFGNPRAGTPLMVAQPLIALELPLRALVWQDRAGQVWISYAEASYLAERYAIPPDLERVLASVEGLVGAALRAGRAE